jgi:hypothetical protein
MEPSFTRVRIGVVVLVLAGVAPLSCGGGGGSAGGGGAMGTASGGSSGTASGGASGTASGGSTGSGGSSGPTSSGVQGSKRLDALTTDEKKKLCDFEAQRFGGYGQSIDCGGGNSLDADPSQQDCISNWPTTCAATVNQAEACSKDATCANPIPQSCAAIFQCLLG